MPSLSKPFRWQSRIRFVDTDASQRIHYTAMFRHFEAAEQDFLRALGVPYADPGFKDISFPRVHVECDFLAQIRYDDLIDIELIVERVGTSSFSVGFAVSVSERPSAKGRITVVCIDKSTGRSCPLPERIREALRSHLA